MSFPSHGGDGGSKPLGTAGNMWGGDSVAFIKQAKSYGFLEKMFYFHPDAGGNYETLAALEEELP